MEKEYYYRRTKIAYFSIIPVLIFILITSSSGVHFNDIILILLLTISSVSILYIGLRKIKFVFNEKGFFYLNKQFEVKHFKDVRISSDEVVLVFDESEMNFKKEGIAVVSDGLTFRKKDFVGKNWNENLVDFQNLKEKIINK